MNNFRNFPPRALQTFFVKLIYSKLFSEKVDLTEFLQKIVEEKFANFHTSSFRRPTLLASPTPIFEI